MRDTERERERERGRDTGRGRSRIPEGSPKWGSILEPRNHNLSQRQALNHWATQVFLQSCLNNGWMPVTQQQILNGSFSMLFSCQ